MKPKQLKTWRKSLGLKQAELADLLGIKRRIIQYYEKGERDGKRLEIPRSIALACYALAQGIANFDGEQTVTFTPPATDNAKTRKASVKSK